MPTVRENLIAAKALIVRSRGKGLNPLNSLRDSVPEERDRIAAYQELRRALPTGHKYVMQWVCDASPSKDDIKALFDRAIAACPDP